MKRHFTAAMLIIVMMILSSGCLSSKGYKSPGNLANEQQTDIMECFINKDGETLKGFFSEYVLENYPDIDMQIEAAFDFLDGEIVSYDEPFSSEAGSFEKKSYGAKTRHIITDKGTEYTIGFKGWYAYDKEPDKVGITVIVVRNETIREELDRDGVENASKLFRLCIGETAED